ncbi:hypothetical protein EJ110_NYTH57887 [Nymphaea thermarum]|nr:hypothetical protein EJ110_NYTH57887 [Nymphaea thermarum]
MIHSPIRPSAITSIDEEAAIITNSPTGGTSSDTTREAPVTTESTNRQEYPNSQTTPRVNGMSIGGNDRRCRSTEAVPSLSRVAISHEAPGVSSSPASRRRLSGASRRLIGVSCRCSLLCRPLLPVPARRLSIHRLSAAVVPARSCCHLCPCPFLPVSSLPLTPTVPLVASSRDACCLSAASHLSAAAPPPVASLPPLHRQSLLCRQWALVASSRDATPVASLLSPARRRLQPVVASLLSPPASRCLSLRSSLCCRLQPVAASLQPLQCCFRPALPVSLRCWPHDAARCLLLSIVRSRLAHGWRLCEANTSSFVSSGEMRSSPFSSLITKMNGGNYEMRAMQVKRTLIAHDKEHLILEPEPVQKVGKYTTWFKDNSLVMVWIVGTLSQDIANEVLHKENAKDMWDSLAATYSQARNETRIMQLHHDIHQMRQDGRPLHTYYSSLKSMFERLNNYFPACKCEQQKAYRDMLMVGVFLSGLDSVYESAKNQMLTSPSIPPIDEAYSRLSRIPIPAATAVADGENPTTSRSFSLSLSKAEYEHILSQRAALSSSSVSASSRAVGSALSTVSHDPVANLLFAM